MSDVLEHLQDLPRALQEVSRVARPGALFLFDTIDRSWSSFLVGIVGAEYIVGIIMRGSHDWRLFIRPDELRHGLAAAGFHGFEHEAFDPSIRSLAELTLFNIGFLSAEKMRGGWNIGPPSSTVVSYIGHATKASPS